MDKPDDAAPAPTPEEVSRVMKAMRAKRTAEGNKASGHARWKGLGKRARKAAMKVVTEGRQAKRAEKRAEEAAKE